MDQIINGLDLAGGTLTAYDPVRAEAHAHKQIQDAKRRLEECRALLTRLANGEPAPEGHTFEEWARELLA